MKRNIKEFSDYISFHAMSEAEIYPVDRFFLEPFVPEILALNEIEFVKYNFETSSFNYSIRLMLCLPEVWSKFDYDKMIALYRRFDTIFEFLNFIIFTNAYLEVDFIQEILNDNVIAEDIKRDIRTFLASMYPN
ncbi:hypothetical protein [Chitinophaga sp. Cy-1792]|uniref:hypothetical protein n=1 Tax=Chitinophaga sp. Cy-1792 TaxID=2608339 RepID=UPI001424136F|nr:hypothetical protein [Chitinophaga sp. Cy-1792]NIG55389.1 hypothetical protein [Chitinophaga sp. Cy-1792]